MAWAAVAMCAGNIDRSLTAVNRLATLQGPPGTGKTTLARNLAAPLGPLLEAPVTVIELAGHEIWARSSPDLMSINRLIIIRT